MPGQASFGPDAGSFVLSSSACEKGQTAAGMGVKAFALLPQQLFFKGIAEHLQQRMAEPRSVGRQFGLGQA